MSNNGCSGDLFTLFLQSEVEPSLIFTLSHPRDDARAVGIGSQQSGPRQAVFHHECSTADTAIIAVTMTVVAATAAIRSSFE
jgi:hypothetical protein